MMRRGASLDTNQARRQLLEERKNIATLQLTADHHLASSIHAVDLEDRLGNVETNCRDRLHVWLLRIVGALTAPTSLALSCRCRSHPQQHNWTSQPCAQSEEFKASGPSNHLPE